MNFLNSLWQGYKKIARKIGVFQSKLILTLFYLLLTPFGIFFSYFKDELRMKSQKSSTWIKKVSRSETLSDLSGQ